MVIASFLEGLLFDLVIHIMLRNESCSSCSDSGCFVLYFSFGRLFLVISTVVQNSIAMFENWSDEYYVNNLR